MVRVKAIMADKSGMSISFDCPRCKKDVDDFVENAFFDISADSDGIGYVETVIECEHCSAPYTVAVLARMDTKEVTVKGHENINVSWLHDEYDESYDEFLAEYEPQDPKGVFDRAITEMDNLYNMSAIASDLRPNFNRMIHLSYIIALEAYLSDRLIKVVTNDSKKLLALVGSTKALREQQPKLIDMAKDPNLVMTLAKKYLQRYSFHDLAGVAVFYQAVLGVELFEDEHHRVELENVIVNRHHLVHRNGRDENGNLIVVDEAAIEQVLQLTCNLAVRIESAFDKYDIERWFDPSDVV